ncbi:MAG: hypothetical protein ACRDPW_03835 [Mycobacteriales bacterium]
MNSERTGKKPGGPSESADATWQQYCEAVRGLGELPQAIARRHGDADAQNDNDLAAARTKRDEQLIQAQRWRTLAQRALSNAQARLVAAQVLIPDVGPAASQDRGATPADLAVEPADLERQLRQAVADVDSDVAAVRTARRRAVDKRARDELDRRAAAQRSRRLRFAVAALGVAALLALLILVI